MKQRYPFAAVLVDMDGVIIDDEDLHHAVWKEFTSRHGMALNQDQLNYTHGRRAVDVIAHFFQTSDPARIDALLSERETLYETHLKEDELHPVPGIREFLSALNAAGVKCVLGTSALPSAAQIILSRLEVSNLFFDQVTGVDVKHGKPSPEVWELAAAKAAVSPRECLVIEDAFAGVTAAKAAGAKCLGICSSFTAEQLHAHGADWVARDFNSLPPELVPTSL